MSEKEELEKIKNSLSIEQVENLLFNLGAEPRRQGGVLVSKTICHCGHSHKLFYYDNTKLFKCYTECSETFDIFELIIKVYKIIGNNFVLPQAKQYILNYFGMENFNLENHEDELEDWKIINHQKEYKRERQIVEFKFFNEKIIKYLPKPRILPWEQEGIKKEIMNYHNICYNPSSQAIVIPHYDKNGKLIGIRERTLIKENEKYGKYRPSVINNKMYNHPLGFNLYNLNNSKRMIKDFKKAIVFEGEKSPLLYASYFGKENDITVACCGSTLSSYQVDLLLDLDVKEIIIAFDKQFKEIGDEEWRPLDQKII